VNDTMKKINLPSIDIFPALYLMAGELTLQIIHKVVVSNDSILIVPMEQKLGRSFCPLRNYDLASYNVLDDLVKLLFHISGNLAIEIMEWCNEYDTVTGGTFCSL
jgi:hypothetical protein